MEDLGRSPQIRISTEIRDARTLKIEIADNGTGMTEAVRSRIFDPFVTTASFLDGDSLPRFGENHPGWKASGKRVKRGLYQSANGSLINADLNGAANILRKANVNM